MIREDLI